MPDGFVTENENMSELTSAARAKLDEIRAEQSLPADATQLLDQVVGLAEALEARQNNHAGGLVGQRAAVDGVRSSLEGLGLAHNLVAARVEALEARPSNAVQISPTGVAANALANALTRIAAGRENGALGGLTATILEDVIAALGAREAPPPPPPEPAPEAPPAEAPAPAQPAFEQAAPVSQTSGEQTNEAAPAETTSEAAQPELVLDTPAADAGDVPTEPASSADNAAAGETQPVGAGG